MCLRALDNLAILLVGTLYTCQFNATTIQQHIKFSVPILLFLLNYIGHYMTFWYA
jgi:hypothetical protein